MIPGQVYVMFCCCYYYASSLAWVEDWNCVLYTEARGNPRWLVRMSPEANGVEDKKAEKKKKVTGNPIISGKHRETLTERVPKTTRR
jgi:hypothetical protein